MLLKSFFDFLFCGTYILVSALQATETIYRIGGGTVSITINVHFEV